MVSSRRRAARSAGRKSRVPRGARNVGMGASLAAGPAREGFPGHIVGSTIRTVSTSRLSTTFAGYLTGVALGTACLTLIFLGMRSVMEIGGACAEGGPYVPVQPCPDGAPLALIGGSFGLFGAAGLMIWFGSRLGRGYVSLVFLGWPILFVSLGFNFLQFGLNPPEAAGPGPEWGFLIPGILFWIIGIGPLLFAIWGGREARRGRPTSSSAVVLNRLSRSVTLPEDRIEYAPNSWGSPRSPSAGAADGDQTVDELERLSRLHDAGSLTDEEFAAAKARILTTERLA